MSTESDFLSQARLHASGLGRSDAFWRAFLESTFHCVAARHSGFLATSTPTGPVVAVLSSERELARHGGGGRSFSVSGADLLAFTPVGHRFVVDPGSAHQFVIDPARLGGLVPGPGRARENRHDETSEARR